MEPNRHTQALIFLLIGGKLCKDDLENLEDWKYPWEDKLFGKLTLQGFRDMESLAKNLKTRLEFLKSASKDKFKVSDRKMYKS